jgi:hypothetical protein
MTLPLFPFDNTIPFGTHNPSADQPIMLANNQASLSISQVDHFGYNVNSGGYHQQVRMANRTTYPLSPNPPAVITGFGGVFCDQTVSTTGLNETGLWYYPDGRTSGSPATPEIYQMTRTIDGSYPLFAKNTNNYNGVGMTFAGGWTFLPGGLLLQYGFAGLVTAAGVTITFPVPFLIPPFSIQMTQITSGAGAPILVGVSGITNTGFTAKSTVNAQVNWIAIGT